MKPLNILIACEESQAECAAFRELGHRAFSCDLQTVRRGGRVDWHIKGDALRYLQGKTSFRTQDGKVHCLSRWDLIVAHPPCTYLCRLSSCRMYIDGKIDIERYNKMIQGREFFYSCLNASAEYVAVENPVPMTMAFLPRPNAYACPSWYGCKYTKKTCYWLKNLPPLMAGAQFENPKCLVKSTRDKYRSRTYIGLAKALAAQWSEYILNQRTHKKR